METYISISKDWTDDQREIFRAVLTKAKNKDTAMELYNFLDESEKSEINISKTKAGIFGAAAIMRRFGDTSLGEVKNDFIPGQGDTIYSEKLGANLYFWVVNEEEKDNLVKEYLK